MKDCPRNRSFLGDALLSALALAATLGAACGEDQAVAQGDPDSTGALTGTVQTFVADFPDGHSERQHFLDLGDPVKRSVRLTFSSAPDLGSGDKVRVWGAERSDELVVTRFEKLPAAIDDVSIVRALTAGAPKMNTNAFVLVDTGGGVNITSATANTNVFSPGNNFANVYNTLSYGSMLYTGDVVGPFTYSMSTCNYSGLQKAIKPMIAGTYNHYMWYLGSNVSACAWSGLGAEGSAAKPASDSWYNASTGCTVLVQEVGHNDGWMHSSTLTCSGASFVDNPTSCTTSEYGNRYTPMGSGCGHFVAMDKWYGGYFTGCNGVKVSSSGTFNLMPIETACNAIQGLQIVMPKTTRTFKAQQDTSAYPIKNYYLELRVNGAPGESTSVKAPAVFVNVGDDIQVATKTSRHSFLLDMNPSTANSFDGMTAPGQSFSDPGGGLTFTVMSIDATHASIQVTYDNPSGAAATCMDGTTLAGAGPTDCGSSPTTTGAAGASGMAGTTGAGGTTGVGGTTGRGGTSGAIVTGTAGRGATSGTSGAAGTTGSPGATGAAGTIGSAGPTATAGTSGIAGGPATGTAGATGSGTGTAGTSGAAGSPHITGAAATGGPAAPGQAPPPVVGGCACTTAPQSAGPSALTWLALGAVAASTRRRRRGP